jgi:prevent-host-death family protein
MLRRSAIASVCLITSSSVIGDQTGSGHLGFLNCARNAVPYVRGAVEPGVRSSLREVRHGRHRARRRFQVPSSRLRENPTSWSWRPRVACRSRQWHRKTPIEMRAPCLDTRDLLAGGGLRTRRGRPGLGDREPARAGPCHVEVQLAQQGDEPRRELAGEPEWPTIGRETVVLDWSTTGQFAEVDLATVTAFEAKTRFGELLERVSKGEEVVITRHDKPVARLVPEGVPRHDEVRRSVEGLRDLQRRIRRRSKAKLTDRDVRAAIDKGRL